jgi:hypothetical protein
VTFIDVGVGTPEERRVSIVNDGDRAILAVGVPGGWGGQYTFTEEGRAYMTRHPLMVLIANLTEVAYALPWEDAPLVQPDGDPRPACDTHTWCPPDCNRPKVVRR